MGRAAQKRHDLFIGLCPAKYAMRHPFPNRREHLNVFVEKRRQSHPHAVRQPGLLRSRLGDDQFFHFLDERRNWIAAHCQASCWVDTLIEDGAEVGRLYRFADLREADWFRFVF